MLSNLGGLALAGANQSGSSSGTTYAAVSDGTLIIRDRAGQQQDVSGLSRDTAGANSGSLNPIFDKEKVESRMQQAQLMSDIGAQALDIASTEGAIAATKAANDKVAEASEAVRRAKGSELAQANPNKAITQDDITQALYQSYYDEAMRTSPYGTGGAVRQGIQAVTAALQGVLAGNMAQALTGAAAPYMAEAIHRATTDAAGNTDVAANTLAHALLGAVVAQASGNNALAGAAGEAGGELAARALMEALYPGKKPSELNEEQKQYISTLATIAGGLAAGVVGNTGADAVQGAQSAQVAVENNYLSSSDITTFLDKYAKAKTEEEKEKLREELKQKDAEQQAQARATGISVKDQKAELEKLKALMASPDCNTECQSLAAYSISQLEPVTNDTQLHKDNLVKDGLVAVIFGIMDGISSGAGKAKSQEVSATAKVGNSALDDILQGESQTAKNVATNNFEIKQLPDANGNTHLTAVRNDTHIPVDKVELFMRGKASGNLEELQQEYNSLKDLQIANQSLFAKDKNNTIKLKQIEDKIHNIERSREMDRVLNNAGITNTPDNNSMIIDKLLNSTAGVTPANRRTSVVVSGESGSVRIYATWTILPDGSKRLSTIQTGAFK
ncbi:MAG: VENN motif pre-toxin domain-containing protein [Dickeya sp.]